MARKLLKLLLACLIAVSAAGCGDSSAAISSVAISSDDTEMESSFYLGIIEDYDTTYEDYEMDLHKNGYSTWQFDDIYEEIASDEEEFQAAVEDFVSYGCSVILFMAKGSADFAESYSFGEYDVELLIGDSAYENATDNSTAATGIMFISETEDWIFGNYRANNGIRSSISFTVSLDLIDPETGEISNFRTFSSKDTHSCTAVIGSIGGCTTCTRRFFNEDFTAMTALLVQEDGSQHIGWIDESGEFTDVSKLITVENDFNALTMHEGPCFFNGYLYFRDSTNDNVQVKRVPLDNLNCDSVEILLDDTDWNGVWINPLPDGSVVDSPSAYVYDTSVNYTANSNFVTDWITENICVGDDDGMIYKYYLNDATVSNALDWYQEKEPLIPSVKGRENWSAVASPDGEQIAFLSRLTSEGNTTPPSIFVVSSDGGDPVKIDTSDLFEENYASIVDGFSYALGLFDWK